MSIETDALSNSPEESLWPLFTVLKEKPSLGVVLEIFDSLVHNSIHPCFWSLIFVIECMGIKAERTWAVLEARYGLRPRMTFDEIAQEILGGVTRSRAQQIESKAREQIEKKIENIRASLDLLEIQAEFFNTDEDVLPKDAIQCWRNNLIAVGWYEPSDEDVCHLITLLRFLVSEDAKLCRLYPKLTLAACSLEPSITAHPQVQLLEQASKKKWTYVELAEEILIRAGQPLHYREIALRAESLGVRNNIGLHSLHNALIYSDNFVQVDSGTYGLKKWGIDPVETYQDVIAEILKEKGGNVTFGELLHEVNARRQIKNSTLMWLLGTNPRFYEAMDGSYGLRAWLPPREKQTLRTPKHKIETQKSLQRVQRAIDRGYNVERIVEQDKYQ